MKKLRNGEMKIVKLRKFIIHFITIFGGSITIYGLFRLVIDIIDYMITDNFNFSIPLDLIISSAIGAVIVSILLFFEK